MSIKTLKIDIASNRRPSSSNDSLEEQLNAANDKVHQLQDKLATMYLQIENQQDNKQYKSKFSSDIQNHRSPNASEQSMNVNLIQTNEKIKPSEIELRNLQDLVAKLKFENTYLKEENLNLKRLNESKKTINSHLNAKLIEMSISSKNGENAQSSQLNSVIEQHQTEMANFQTQLNQCNEELLTKENKLNETSQENEKLKNENRLLKETVDRLQSQQPATSPVLTLNQAVKFENCNEEIIALKKQRDKAIKDHDKVVGYYTNHIEEMKKFQDNLIIEKEKYELLELKEKQTSEENHSLRTFCNSAKEEFNEMKIKLEKLIRENDLLETEIKRLKSCNQPIEPEPSFFDISLQRLTKTFETKISVLEKELADSKAINQELEIKLNEQTQAQINLQADLKNTNDLLNKKIEEKISQINELNVNITSLSKEICQLNEKFSTKQQEYENLRSLYQCQIYSKIELEKHHAVTLQRVETLTEKDKENIQTKETVKSLRDALDQKSKEKSSIEISLAEITSQKNKMETRLAEISSEFTLQETTIKNLNTHMHRMLAEKKNLELLWKASEENSTKKYEKEIEELKESKKAINLKLSELLELQPKQEDNLKKLKEKLEAKELELEEAKQNWEIELRELTEKFTLSNQNLAEVNSKLEQDANLVQKLKELIELYTSEQEKELFIKKEKEEEEAITMNASSQCISDLHTILTSNDEKLRKSKKDIEQLKSEKGTLKREVSHQKKIVTDLLNKNTQLNRKCTELTYEISKLEENLNVDQNGKENEDDQDSDDIIVLDKIEFNESSFKTNSKRKINETCDSVDIKEECGGDSDENQNNSKHAKA